MSLVDGNKRHRLFLFRSIYVCFPIMVTVVLISRYKLFIACLDSYLLNSIDFQ